jgi:hypothetical protein
MAINLKVVHAVDYRKLAANRANTLNNSSADDSPSAIPSE